MLHLISQILFPPPICSCQKFITLHKQDQLLSVFDTLICLPLFLSSGKFAQPSKSQTLHFRNINDNDKLWLGLFVNQKVFRKSEVVSIRCKNNTRWRHLSQMKKGLLSFRPKNSCNKNLNMPFPGPVLLPWCDGTPSSITLIQFVEGQIKLCRTIIERFSF